jgi:hypothetical protein
MTMSPRLSTDLGDGEQKLSQPTVPRMAPAASDYQNSVGTEVLQLPSTTTKDQLVLPMKVNYFFTFK